PLERAFDSLPDVLRPTIQVRYTLHSARIKIRSQVEAKFGGDHYLLSKGSERFTHDCFVCEGTICFGGVEKCDAAFDGRPDQRDHCPLVACRTIASAHSHTAEPESRNFQVAI